MESSLQKFHPTSSSELKFSEEFERFNISDHSDSDEEYEDDNNADFTFACVADDDTSFSAEDIFDNGKIRPVFPLFDQRLVFNGDLPHMPPVKKIFVETCDAPPLQAATERTSETTGPHCTLYGKVVEVSPAASPDSCKKSNSTGFSKIWRFKEMSNRSHSDGRDAFVFLNKPALEKKSKDSAAAAKGKTSGGNGRNVVSSGGERGRAAAMAAKKKGGGKGKTVASAHEVYVKSRAATREDDRRRSYLPYKPELVGFFTNVQGGMSKNVHPF